jgi:hypothetical protein
VLWPDDVLRNSREQRTAKLSGAKSSTSGLPNLKDGPEPLMQTSSDCWAHQSGAFEAIVLSDIDRWAKGKFLANSDQR